MEYLQYRMHSLGWEDVACIINVPPVFGTHQQTTRRHTAKCSNTVTSASETSNLTCQSVRLNHEFESPIRVSRGLDTPR